MNLELIRTQPEKTVEKYFKASFEGGEQGVLECFCEDAVISGSFSGEIVKWTLQEFVQRILSQKNKKNTGVFNKKMIGSERTSAMAIIRAENQVGELLFLDTLMLINEEGQWRITAKWFMLASEVFSEEGGAACFGKN